MKKKMIKLVNCILVCLLVFYLAIYPDAATIGQLQQNIEANNNALADVNAMIMGLEDEQDLLDEQISDADAELVNTMTEIGLKEEEIEAKKGEISVAQAEYDAAKAQEEAQYNAMVWQIQFMYERGDADYLAALFDADSYDEVLPTWKQCMITGAIF